MANTFENKEEFKENFLNNLASKLFVEYTGKIQDIKNLDFTSSDSKFRNTIFFCTETNEICVNGTFYGASNEFIKSLKNSLQKLFGAEIIDDDFNLKNENNDELKGLVASFVEKTAKKLAREEIAQVTINNASEGHFTIKDNLEAYKAGDKNEREISLELNIDNSTLVWDDNTKALRGDLRLIIAQSGWTVLSTKNIPDDSDNVSTKTRLILYTGGVPSMQSNIMQFGDASEIIQIVDADYLVRDALIKEVQWDKATHTLTIEWKGDENHDDVKPEEEHKTVIDFSDLVDVKDIHVDNEGGQYIELEVTEAPVSENDEEHKHKSYEIGLNVIYGKPGVSEFAEVIDSSFNNDLNHTGITDLNDPTLLRTGGNPQMYAVGKLVDSNIIGLEFAKRDEVYSNKINKAKEESASEITNLKKDLYGGDGLNYTANPEGEGKLNEVLKTAEEFTTESIKNIGSTTIKNNSYIEGTIEIKEDGTLDNSISPKFVKIMESIKDDTINIDDVKEGIADAKDVANLIQTVETALENYVETRLELLANNVATSLKADGGAWRVVRNLYDL